MDLSQINTKSKESQTHDYFLEKLIYHLSEIDENQNEIEWIMKDGVWQKRGLNQNHSLCDLLVGYFGGFGVPIELKGSVKKKSKAKKQIISGREFLEDVLKIPVSYGKVVIYGPRMGYKYFTYDFKKNRWA